MKAQELYNQLLEHFLTPYFEQRGYKKSSNLFYKDFPDFRTLIQIQKSRWNSNDEISFTFNLGIFDKYIYNKLNEGKAIRNPKPEDCILSKRIGRLINDGNDKWYDFDSSVDVEKVFDRIKKDFDISVFPWFDQVKEQSDLVTQYKTETDIYIIVKGLDLYIGLHSLRRENHQEAKEYLVSQIKKLSHNTEAQDRIRNIAEANGIKI